jgi:hypothetical protein
LECIVLFTAKGKGLANVRGVWGAAELARSGIMYLRFYWHEIITYTSRPRNHVLVISTAGVSPKMP